MTTPSTTEENLINSVERLLELIDTSTNPYTIEVRDVDGEALICYLTEDLTEAVDALTKDLYEDSDGTSSAFEQDDEA